MLTLDIPALFFGLYGLILGSYLNVVVYRLPAGIPTSYPASRCPRCLMPIRPWHNVPVLGWIFLRGRCRDCQTPISPRYPLVEATTGILFVLSWRTFDTVPEVLSALLFSCLMVVLGLIDLDHRALPDELTLSSVVLGIGASLVVGRGTLLELLAAALLGWCVLAVPSWIWSRWRGEVGFGAGDGRMLAGVGAFSGIEGVWLTLTLSCGLASVSWLLARGLVGASARGWLGTSGGGGVAVARGLVASLPFGSFMAVSALVTQFTLGSP